MKTQYFYSLLILLMVFGGCSKVIIYEPSDEEIAKYGKVYMPRAEQQSSLIVVSNQEEVRTLQYSAYLGGPIDAKEDITVTFGVDQTKVAEFNEANESNYALLPASAYELQGTTATIKSGERSTPALELKLKSGSHLDLFATYVLPVGIVQASASVNEELTTAYYVVTVAYPPGQVPTELVLSLGPDYGRLLGIYSQGGLLTTKRDPVSGATYRWEYKVDAEGRFTSPPVRLGDVDWVDARTLYYHNDDSVFLKNLVDAGGWSHVWRAKVDRSNPNVLVDYAPFPQHHMGIEWDWAGPNIVHIVPFRKYTLTVNGAGVLRRQGMFTRSPGWTWETWHMPEGVREEVGTGLTGLRNLLPYKDKALLAVDNDGKLWYYPMSADAKPGVRRQVGSGWDMYNRILVSGDDILAVDNNNDVYRYEFNPIGFYPLK